MTDQGPIEFIDPDTGEFYKVKPVKATVEAAFKLGYLPVSEEDHERADAIALAQERP